MRAILDTNIVVAGLSSRRGASHLLLQKALVNHFTLLASPALWLEYEAVLKRPEILEMHGFSPAQVDDFLNGLAAFVEPVTSHFLWRPQLKDPKDEMVLEAAVNGRAGHLVTMNMRDFLPAAGMFGVVVSAPGPFLKLLEQRS